MTEQFAIDVARNAFMIALEIGVHRSVVAFDLRDGRRAWAVEVPATFDTLAVVDHRLFGIGADGITAFVAGA